VHDALLFVSLYDPAGQNSQESLRVNKIDSFFNTPTAGRGVQVDLYPTCIQTQRTVGASKSHEISNHITRHSAVNIGQILSIQVTNCSTIS
jgi:hypothetical protein